MDRSDKCGVSKAHISSNCRKLDSRWGRQNTQQDKQCSLEETLSLKLAIHSKIMITNFSKI